VTCLQNAPPEPQGGSGAPASRWRQAAQRPLWRALTGGFGRFCRPKPRGYARRKVVAPRRSYGSVIRAWCRFRLLAIFEESCRARRNYEKALQHASYLAGVSPKVGQIQPEAGAIAHNYSGDADDKYFDPRRPRHVLAPVAPMQLASGAHFASRPGSPVTLRATRAGASRSWKTTPLKAMQSDPR
jgi:hypothetical protein